MTQDKKVALLAARTLDELLDAEYGKVGTPSRDQFDAEAEAFCLAATLREERLQAGISQAELAERAGVPRSTVSKVENGNSHVSLAMAARLFNSVGRQLRISVL